MKLILYYNYTMPIIVIQLSNVISKLAVIIFNMYNNYNFYNINS